MCKNGNRLKVADSTSRRGAECFGKHSAPPQAEYWAGVAYLGELGDTRSL